jgi:hypothetical protein
MIRKKLSDVLAATERGKLAKVWDECEAAPDDGPLPRGEYVAVLQEGRGRGRRCSVAAAVALGGRPA